MDIVIIGGVAAGMSAAARLRRLDETATITVVERSGNISFANCGLPYHVGGVIEERESLLLQTPKAIKDRFEITALVGTEATAIDRERREVHVTELASGTEQVLHYDHLVLAPGARPVRPPIPGIERALGLRTVEDVDAIIAALEGDGEHPAPRTATVIGGGFIGLELAENLLHRGLAVTIVEATDQVMAPLDPEMVAPVHEALRAAGVDLRLGSGVTAIGEQDVTLADGSTVPAELVVAAIGVQPDSRLAEQAGLELGPRGAIVVDENWRTSDPHVFAAGDAVTKVDALDGSTALVPLANTANLQGRRIADVIAGRQVRERGVLGTAIVGLLGLQVAATGWNEKRLRAAEHPHRVIHTHPSDHAGYYPGASTMALKLLVDPTDDRILGAQGVGQAGVDKRIDVIATAITGGITASGLAELELAYAPQFASAKDPVNMLGFIAENLATGTTSTVQWHELDELRRQGRAVIDVRTPAEFAAGAIDGAVNIPVDELRGRLDEVHELSTGGAPVVHCAVGIRGHIACRILDGHGIEAFNLDGGWRTWQAGHAAGA